MNKVSPSEFAKQRGLTTIQAHKHLRKHWMPAPVQDKPPLWDLDAVERAEQRYADVQRWLTKGDKT